MMRAETPICHIKRALQFFTTNPEWASLKDARWAQAHPLPLIIADSAYFFVGLRGPVRLCLDPIEVRRLFGSAISLDGVSAG